MVRLDEICSINMGQSPDSSFYNESGDGIPFFQGNADFGEINPKVRVWCSEPTKIANVGDILISVRAPIGALNIANMKCCIGRGLAALTVKENLCTKEYLWHALKSKIIELNSKGTGSTFKAISKNILAETSVQLYSIERQKEIANIFDKMDELISCRKEQLAKLDEFVKARFVEMFGLPVSNSKNWKTEKMNDIAPAVNYSGKFEETVWLLNLDMVEAQTGRIIDYLYVSEEEVGNSTCTFDTSNVLYSKLRPYLNKVVIPNKCGYATSEMIPLKPNPDKLERTYLAFMLRSDEFVNMINEKVAGAKMPRVSMSDFRGFDVPVPPMDKQKEFAAFVEQADKTKAEVQKSLDELEILKKSLMQKYFG